MQSCRTVGHVLRIKGVLKLNATGISCADGYRQISRVESFEAW
jgi:hypothetical protein